MITIQELDALLSKHEVLTGLIVAVLIAWWKVLNYLTKDSVWGTKERTKEKRN
jgi:hypothetical protein